MIARGNARAVAAERDGGGGPADRVLPAEGRRAPAAAGADAVVTGGPDTGGNEIYRVQAEGSVRIFTADRPGAGRSRGLRHRPGGAGDDRARPEADHAERCADRAGQPGILVAEAHGGGARQCRGGDQRRAAARGRHAGRLHDDATRPAHAGAQQAEAGSRRSAGGVGQAAEGRGVRQRHGPHRDRHRDRRPRRLCAGHRHRAAGGARAHHARAEPARWIGGGSQHEDRHFAAAGRHRRAGAGPGRAERRHQPATRAGSRRPGAPK